MSSTRGGKDPTDLFTTPAWTVDAVLPHLPRAGLVVDAGCGNGAILARVAQKYDAGGGCRFLGLELDAERCAKAEKRMTDLGLRSDWQVDQCDFLTCDLSDIDASVVISNPPFSLAQRFIERSLEMVRAQRGTVAVLLRYTWHVAECRAEFVKRFPFDLGGLSKRPDFAASLKCKSSCGWRLMQEIDAPRPKVCPSCGIGGVSVVTNDSSEYAWLIYGPGRGGRFFPLDIDRPAKRVQFAEPNGGAA